MSTWGGYICTLFTLLGASSAELTWSYYAIGPSEWGNGYHTCAGKQQSPINFIRSESTSNPKFKIEHHDYNNNITGSITNIGYTVNFVLNMTENSAEPSVLVSIGDGKYDGTYYLKSMHFHIPSEHLDEYASNEGEMVLMHTGTKGDIMGMSYPITTCRADRKGYLPPQLKDALMNLTEMGNSVDFDFNPAFMLDVEENTSVCGFYSYPGSLTWPPCTENVFWMVRQRGVCTTSAMMTAFHNITDHTGRPLQNSRPVQPVNDRKVLHHPC